MAKKNITTCPFGEISELEALMKADTVIDQLQARLASEAKSGKCWTIYGWPERTGKLLGAIKTSMIDNIDIPQFKYAPIAYKAMGVVPFINKDGVLIQRDPDFQILKKALWCICRELKIADEMFEELDSLDSTMWEKMKSAAMRRLDKAMEAVKAEADLNLEDCPL